MILIRSISSLYESYFRCFLPCGRTQSKISSATTETCDHEAVLFPGKADTREEDVKFQWSQTMNWFLCAQVNCLETSDGFGCECGVNESIDRILHNRSFDWKRASEPPDRSWGYARLNHGNLKEDCSKNDRHLQ